MRKIVALATLLASIAAPAMAQGGPSFDCAKASNAIERAVCKDSELAKADHDMAAAYAALVGKLSGSAKDHILKDQTRWIGDRDRACTGDIDDIVTCLKQRYAARTANLEAFAIGAYPFIGEHALVDSGKLGNITWSYDIAYPQFEGTAAGFESINGHFADAAKEEAKDATPKAAAGPDNAQQWTYEQGFKIYRPGSEVVTLAVNYYGYSGGAHGYGATSCTLIDLRSGRTMEPAGVFKAGEQWLGTMTQIVRADLRKQFVEKPGFDDALQPANLAKLLGESGHYCWRADRLELIFNAYEVGPYASGPYEVSVPYDQLKSLLRADGPISR